MKFALALLATLVLGGTANLIRGKHATPHSQTDEQWNSQVPEINNPKIQERTWKDGSEYRYLYDGQILTGMPDVHLQFAGSRVRAIVKIQNNGDKDVMQIEKVFVGSLHERFVSDPRSMIQLDAFEPMQEQDAPFEEVLKMPVRFTVENGKVDNFEATETDPSWSINIKRAILNTFHLSLTDKEEPKDQTRRETLKPLRAEQSNEIKPRPTKTAGQQTAEDDQDDYFTVVEDSIAGRCEVSYLVLEQPANKPEEIYPIYENENETKSEQRGQSQRQSAGQELNVLNVTKTFDYRNCEFQPFVFKGIHLTSTCPGCESRPEDFFNILESAAHTRYNITGARQSTDYLIESAISAAVYKITPRSHFAGSLVAYAGAEVTLIQSGPIKGPINFPETNANQIDGLHMINPRFERREGEKFLYEAPEASRPIVQLKKYWPNVDEKPRKVKALFEKLVQGMEEKEIKSDTAVLIEHIIHLLEYSFEEEIQQIHNEIKTVSVAGVEKEEIDHMFADLLVSTGTNCTFTYLKKLIKEKKIQGSTVIDVLGALPFRMQVDKISGVMLQEMSELCMDESVSASPFVERACWLSFGTFVHKACVHRPRAEWDQVEAGQNSPKTQGTSRASQQSRQSSPRQSGARDQPEFENRLCPADVRQTIVQKVTEKLKSFAEDDEKKILIIKVLGNMGLEETIDELAAIAVDMTEPIYIRTQAIYAMRIMGLKYQSEEVLEVLLPLYRESKNPTQIRIAAFLTIMSSKPDLPLLEDIAQSLNREVDLDVASYVYSSLSSVANSTDPCLQNLTRDARIALQFATPLNVEFRHSKSIQKGTFLPHMKSGIFWEQNTIMDKDAPAPRAANLRVHANVNMKSFDIVEFGFETEGLGEAARKFLGNFTTENLAEVISGRAARRPRAAGQMPVESINEIDQLLNLKPQEPKEIRGSAYMKIFGQETRFVVINPQTVSRFIVDLISQQESVIPKLMSGEGLKMDNRRVGMLMDSKLEFPTILGVPIGFTVRLPIVTGMKGLVKASMTPKPEGGLAFFKQMPQQVALEMKVKSNIAAELHAKLSVYIGFLRVGTGCRTKLSLNMPLDGKVDFSLADRSTKVTMNLPESPVKLVKMAYYPVTFVTRHSKNSVTYQPKNIPQGLEGQRRTGKAGQTEQDSSSEEQSRQTGQAKTDRALMLDIDEVDTELLTKTGHVSFPKWFNGLPVTIPDLWEIATPAFIKSQDVNFQIGHDSMAAKLEVECEHEYPNTRLSPLYLPVVGAKSRLEVKLTPKAGAKKVTVAIFERNEFAVQSEQELLNKLKDKVEGITIKNLEKPSVPTNYEKMPKMGRSLQVLINAEGGDAVSAWTTRGLLAYLYSVDGRYVKFVGAMDSKVPVLAKKICFNGELRYPDRTGLWFTTPQEALNKSIQGQAELFWGDDLTAEKQIKLRLRYQKSSEQTQVEKFDLYDVNGIPVPLEVASEVREGEALFTSLYKQCEEDRKIGAPFSKECVDLAIRYSDLLRLKFDVDYKNVSPYMRKVLHKLEAVVKGVYHWNTEVEDVEVKNPENKISAVIEYSADRSYVDIKYQTPTQNVTINNIDLPMDVQPASALFPWSPARLVGLQAQPSCTISGPKINTFDDVSDFMPLSQCYHVMVKDATDDNLFAVLVANAAKNSLAKKVLIMFEGHKIEFVPKTEGAAPAVQPNQPIDVKSLYVVKYNGQVLADALTPEKRTTIPPNTPQDKQELADVMLIKPETSGNKNEIIGFYSRVTGLKVLFDGSSVTVMPSPLWKSNVVGLCGKYDGQTWDEKLLPNKTLVAEPIAFSRAFQLNTKGCDAEIDRIPLQKGQKKTLRQQ
ncbi:Vitellogenin-6 [Hypsibius exemplaris]|uniref:Vitellogenin-6 n=1 Tax=Hypsibius exemplaris TaxID=2072580 RepID=A0A1W0X3L9_HYPEX|nr:Vitellogenin-6 [Hypsibius exemplaris]